ncbi:MAG: hypothetical protein HOI64_03705 [Rhodobiaceae bacterium]|nr:hypothetical protein [Rhodobiaceae bacterium]
MIVRGQHTVSHEPHVVYVGTLFVVDVGASRSRFHHSSYTPTNLNFGSRPSCCMSSMMHR